MKRSLMTASLAVLVASSAGAASPSPKGADMSKRPAMTPTISCPGDAAVWVNARSKAYHLQGDPFFGRTKHGKFECRKAADAEGDHPIPARK